MSLLPLIALIALVASAAGAIWLAGYRSGAARQSAGAAEAHVRSLQEIADANDRMLDAAGDRPADGDDLARRMRDGSF